jgi:uncharacterized protein DUF6894
MRYFINFLRAGQTIKDDEGQDFPGLEEAHAASIVSAREILANDIKAGSSEALEAVFITNGDGQRLATVHATDVLPEPLK